MTQRSRPAFADRIAGIDISLTRGARPLTFGSFLNEALPISIIGGTLVYAVQRFWLMLQSWSEVIAVSQWVDHHVVMEQAHRVLSGGPMYPAWQMSQPILPGMIADLYPPTTVVLLFVPMSLLPDWVWWAVPLSIIGAVVAWHRPSLWGWAVIAGLFVLWPHTWTAIQLGNPTMWFVAAIALGTVWRWPAAFVLLKPTIAPFALVGAFRLHRSPASILIEELPDRKLGRLHRVMPFLKADRSRWITTDAVAGLDQVMDGPEHDGLRRSLVREDVGRPSVRGNEGLVPLAPVSTVAVRSHLRSLRFVKSWWLLAFALLAVNLALIPAWLDYVRVLGNTRFGITYSLHDYGFLAIPVVAWVTGVRRPDVAATLRMFRSRPSWSRSWRP